METLAFAMQMELDSEAYYRRQASKLQNTILVPVFQSLADEEAQHVKLLQAQAAGQPIDLPAENGALTASMNVFRQVDDFHTQHPEVLDQLEPYEAACELEVKSADLYHRMLEASTDEPSRVLYTLLAREEEKHQSVLEELYQHLNRPNTWVEAAEFGVREDY